MAFDKKPYKKKWNGSSSKKEPQKTYKEKRGKLAPLMSEEAKSSANIQELSYDFSCRIIRLYQFLTDPISDDRYEISDEQNQSSRIANPSSNINPSSRIPNHSSTYTREYIMSKQVYRSGTSIGANVREAQHGQSDADFLTKMTIAFKEADETNYWISLLHDNGYLTDEMFTSLDSDIQRILRLLTAITKSTKIKIESAKKK